MRPIGKALSSPLIIQEREGPADRKQTCHSHEASLLSAQVLFRTRKHGEDPYTTLVRSKNEIQIARWKTKESGFSLKDKKKSKSSLKSERRQKHEVKPILIEEGDEQLRRDQLLITKTKLGSS